MPIYMGTTKDENGAVILEPFIVFRVNSAKNLGWGVDYSGAFWCIVVALSAHSHQILRLKE